MVSRSPGYDRIKRMKWSGERYNGQNELELELYLWTTKDGKGKNLHIDSHFDGFRLPPWISNDICAQ